MLVALLSIAAGAAGCGPAPGDGPPEATLYAVLPPGARVNWDALLDRPETEGLRFGVTLMGPEPYSREPGGLFPPASNTKLFTTAAALALLGPSFELETRVTWEDLGAGVAGALMLRGGGDPTWTRDTLDRVVAEMRAAGVRRVRGPVLSEPRDARWDFLRRPEGWQPEDSTACYAALAQSIGYQNNCASFSVTGLSTGRWVDPDVPIPVVVRLSAGAQTRLNVEAVDHEGRPSGAYLITGTWRAGQTSVTSLPVHDAPGWAARALTRRLRGAGIPVDAEGGEAVVQVGRGAVQVRRVGGVTVGRPMRSLSVRSAPIGDLLVRFNKESDNLYGHALWAALGAELGGDDAEDLLEGGRRVMARFLDSLGSAAALGLGVPERPGYYATQALLVDGSGISHLNVVTPDALITLLQDLAARESFGWVWRSLPIAGVDGTLASRMKRTPAQGVLRAKTGTLTGVYNLSGYVPAALEAGLGAGAGAGAQGIFTRNSGENPFETALNQKNTSFYGAGAPEAPLAPGAPETLFPFVILTRGPGGTAGPARAAQDRVGAALAGLIHGPGAPLF
ncbi:MAG: D-alanyl-D-alanine carboxypeptidase/D-alanyl-D-alanine-endopeptidase [Bdellovibrionales bacterium]|nr:D-alanyl-D-alanine carboxypeptidase/D-alanyl-D-alanine-endopeptidase [Bdellovibrionales bacterium]